MSEHNNHSNTKLTCNERVAMHVSLSYTNPGVTLHHPRALCRASAAHVHAVRAVHKAQLTFYASVSVV